LIKRRKEGTGGENSEGKAKARNGSLKSPERGTLPWERWKGEGGQCRFAKGKGRKRAGNSNENRRKPVRAASWGKKNYDKGSSRRVVVGWMERLPQKH